MSVPRLFPPRLVTVDCPDWPVAASGPAGVTPDAPLAVLSANRVVAASRAAREEQVVPGLRRRAAQALCPSLVLIPWDPAHDARAFEDVLRALEHALGRADRAGPSHLLRPRAFPVPRG